MLSDNIIGRSRCLVVNGITFGVGVVLGSISAFSSVVDPENE